MASQEIGLSAVFDLSSWSKNIGKYQSDLGRASSETNKAASSIGKSWNQLGATVGNVAKTMGVAIVAAGAAAGAAVAGFAVSGIQKAADLEAQMSNIAAIFNTTAENVKPLGDLILELGIDPNLKVSTMEAAEAIEMLGKNGLTMAEIMDGAAHSTVLLANATGADFGAAADIATDVMAIFGIEAENMGAAVDGITAVTVASKFTIDDYRLAIAQAGGVAGAVGVDFDDFNTTIAAISPSFASGSDAGTSFKTMLQRLLPQSAEAEEMMRELGIITADGANQFFTASGEMKSMNEIAVLLNGALAGLSEEQKLQAVTVLAGADASRAMLGLMDAGAVVYTDAAVAAKALGVSQEEVNKVIEGGVTQFEALQLTMGQTDAAQQAATRMDNFRGAMEILGGVIETLQIQIGQAFLPALTKLARAFTDLVSQNSDKIVGFFQALADNIVALVGYFTEVATSGDTMNDSLKNMSPWLADIVQKATDLSIAIGTTLRDAFTFVQEHADAFKGALVGIGAALAASTISAGITAISGAIASLSLPVGLIILAAGALGYVWNTNWLGMRDKTIEIIDAIKAAFQPFTDAITEFGAGALTEITAFVTGNETEFTNLKAIWDGALESFGNMFGGIRAWVIANLPGFQENLLEWGTAAWDWIVEATVIVGEKMAEWKTAIVDYVANNLETWTTNLAAWTTAAWQWIAAAILVVGAQMATWGTAVLGYVTDNLPTWVANLSEWATAAWEWLTGAITQVGTKLAEWGGIVLNYVVDNLPTWISNLSAWATAAWQWIAGAILVVGTQMATWGGIILDYVTDNLPTWISNLGKWALAAWEWIKDAIPLVTTQLGIWGTAILNYVIDKLPEWRAELLSWGKAAWEWIVDAIPLLGIKLSEWWGVIKTWLDDNYPVFETKINEWSLALYNWISSDETKTNTQTALDEWKDKSLFEKIDTFYNEIDLKMTDLGTALFEWIGESIPGAITAMTDWLIALLQGADPKRPEVAPELAAARKRQQEAFDEMITAIQVSVRLNAIRIGLALFDGFMEGINDWEPSTTLGMWVKSIIQSVKFLFGIESPSTVFATIGNDVMQGFIDGLWAMVGAAETKIGEIKDGLIEKISGVEAIKEWLGVGGAIIGGILDGLEKNAFKILDYLGGLAQQALDAVTNPFGIFGGDDAAGSSVNSSSVMENVGQSIIGGWLNGMSGNDVPNRFSEISEGAFGTITDFWEMRSPSRLMERVGRSLIDGWVLGMANNEHRILAAMQKINLSVSKIAHRAGQDAIDAFTGALGQFSGVGGNLIERITGTQAGDNIANLITGEQGTLEFLQQQADIIQAVRDAGLDPSDVLAGLTLGRNADPLKLAGVVGRTMEELNRGLEQSIKNAASGLTRTIDEMREGRKSITDIEEEFTKEHLSVLGNYANRLEQIDEQIAQAEEQTLRTGGAGMQHLRTLQSQRDRLLTEVKEFHEQRLKMEDLLTKIPTSDNTRAQDAMDRWRAQWLDPLIKIFNEGDIFARRSMMPAIQENLRKLQAFSHQIARITNVESQAMLALEGFGQGARGRVENLLTAMYDPNQVRMLDSNIAALRKFSQELHTIKATLGGMARNRESTDSIIERFMGGVDQLQMYKNAIAGIDEQIARAQAHSLETGSIASLASIRSLDVTRKKSQQELETFLRQTERLADIMGQVRNLSGPGQASAERFLQEMIQPIADAFSGPMRSQEREAWMRTAQDRVDMLNRFVLQMRQVERLQARVAGNQAFTHLADDFALLQDMLMPENTRAGLIVHLDDYITQMMRLHEIQQDITQGRGINPLVDRFASERLDSIAKRLEDINLSEMERNRLIQEYRVEQEKILRLQQKQQQLDFINQQLALIEQLRSLDDEEGWSVDVENILSGIRFGVNASIDDLMMLTGRVLDELVKFANHELGIASPSRVFARVGENIMAGLAAGVESGLRMPMNALRNAAGSLVPYSLQQRALTINMGGVTINDRIDAALFENRIRQVVRSEFAS